MLYCSGLYLQIIISTAQYHKSHKVNKYLKATTYKIFIL